MEKTEVPDLKNGVTKLPKRTEKRNLGDGTLHDAGRALRALRWE